MSDLGLMDDEVAGVDRDEAWRLAGRAVDVDEPVAHLADQMVMVRITGHQFSISHRTLDSVKKTTRRITIAPTVQFLSGGLSARERGYEATVSSDPIVMELRVVPELAMTRHRRVAT